MPGIGKILSLVLLYAIHEVHRFPRVQDFVSSGRLVTCARESAGKRDAAGRWQLSTEFAKGGKQAEASATLLPAAFYGDKGDDRLPLDAKREEVSGEAHPPAFRSAVKPGWLKAHAEAWLGLSSPVPSERGRAVRSGRIPDEALSKEARLRFDDRRVQVLDGTLDPALRPTRDRTQAPAAPRSG